VAQFRDGRTPEMEDLLFRACVQDQRYWDYFDSPRGFYLSQMIDMLADPDGFKAKLWERLSRSRYGKGQLQMLGIARVYAMRGDSRAAELVRRKILHNLRRGRDKELAFMADVFGEAGVVEAAELLETLPAEVRGKELGWKLTSLDDELGEERAKALVDELAGRFSWIRFLVESRSNLQPGYESPKVETLEDLLAGLTSGKSFHWYTHPFRREASDEEFRRAAENLPEEVNVLGNFLRIFHGRAFPLDPEPLMKLTRHRDLTVRWRAYVALEEVKDRRVRKLALGDLGSRRYGRLAANVLVANYEPGDEELLLGRLRDPLDDDFLHRMTGALLDLVKLRPGLDPFELLGEAYVLNPCGFCREYVVRALSESGALPDAWREECRFDAEADVRKLVGA
jgi:hypothetical protein